MARRVAAGTGALVLDAEGVAKLAQGDERAGSFVRQALVGEGVVVASAVTLAEVLHGAPRDAAVHRVLSRIDVAPVTARIGRSAGELLGQTGGSNAVDAVVAATALAQPGPVVVLTSDVPDLTRLTAGHERVRVVAV